MLAKSAKEWLIIFRENGIWAGEVYGYNELVNDPQIAHNGTFVEYDHPTEGHVKTPGFPYKFSQTPAQVYRGAPRVGEDTTEILTGLGYKAEEIKDLLASGNILAMEKK